MRSRFKSFSGRPIKDPRRLFVDRHGYGKSWPSQRKKALERDEYTCQKCGHVGVRRSRGRWDVHVHHKVKIKEFVDLETGTIDEEAAHTLENLVTLCDHGCHKVADGHAPIKGFKYIE